MVGIAVIHLLTQSIKSRLCWLDLRVCWFNGWSSLSESPLSMSPKLRGYKWRQNANYSLMNWLPIKISLYSSISSCLVWAYVDLYAADYLILSDNTMETNFKVKLQILQNVQDCKQLMKMMLKNYSGHMQHHNWTSDRVRPVNK